MINFLKSFVDRVRNTLCLVVASTVISLLIIFLLVLSAAVLLVCIPIAIVFILGCAIYLCFCCWFTHEKDWIVNLSIILTGHSGLQDTDTDPILTTNI